ncbi:uncharacterized protein LOC123303191 [Chrysoperla carnea]|uniref:uncharacterized protein LOC123303191 n=1 Tax=Chrysoperla carnea TaxID=189513 RepID=UPI001D096CDC|nr:uncharacterized protein LOC123303191 [Chrysoperla carnea]
MAVTNAYILYHRIAAERKCEVSGYTKKAEEEKPIELPIFRSQIAEALTENRCNSGRPISLPSSRLSCHSESPAPQSPSPAPTSLFLFSGQKTHHPVEDICFDGYGHMSGCRKLEEKSSANTAKNPKLSTFARNATCTYVIR